MVQGKRPTKKGKKKTKSKKARKLKWEAGREDALGGECGSVLTTRWSRAHRRSIILSFLFAVFAIASTRMDRREAICSTCFWRAHQLWTETVYCGVLSTTRRSDVLFIIFSQLHLHSQPLLVEFPGSGGGKEPRSGWDEIRWTLMLSCDYNYQNALRHASIFNLAVKSIRVRVWHKSTLQRLYRKALLKL